MNIPIIDQLNTTNLSIIIQDYWESSFKSKAITFDLSDTEWITNTEIVFLTGWINKLIAIPMLNEFAS